MFTEYDLAKRAQDRRDFKVTQAVTTGSAYATRNILGPTIVIDQSAGIKGPIEEHGLSAILQSLIVTDPDSQSIAMDFFFFSAPLASAIVDKADFTPSVADMANCIGTVHIAATDFVTSGLASVASIANIGKVLKPGVAGATAIYCVAVIRGAPTYTNGNLYFKFQFSQGL